MTDERDKTRVGTDSRARPTARDVPFTRGAGSESEPAPRGQRPNQLPRDPTYEAELAQVELAVLRDRRSDPSTKQGGRGHQLAAVQAPESVTPESPGAAKRASSIAPSSVDAPSSSGRAVASGTLLSIGAVDPRGRTEPTLETPRMFFSQPEGREVYFKPGKIPAVTVHQTLETETVKLSDSIDPRRAKTMPRIDRAVLARFSEAEGASDSEAPVAVSKPDATAEDAASAPLAWRSVDYEAASPLVGSSEQASEAAGQIHASLSPFRDQAEPSFAFNDVPTRPEPLAARREAEPSVASLPSPDTSALPTQRDLPQHRIEASRPPPAPAPSVAPAVNYPARQAYESAATGSEAPSPTTASIAAPEPRKRGAWTNYAAFFLALLLAVSLGLWLTRSATEPAPPGYGPAPPQAEIEPSPLPADGPPAPAPVRAEPAPRAAPNGVKPSAPSLISPAPQAAPVAPRKSSPPKPPRETIF